MEESDAALVERCRTGSDAAFRELIDRYKNLVYGVILRTVADRSRADDLAQEVFLRVYRGLPSFRGDSSLSTWLFRIARNVCVETRDRRLFEQSLDALASDHRPRVDPGAHDQAFAAIELRDRLDRAMSQLPPAARFLVSAHYLGGQKYEDLARALDMPIGTVKTHLHRARRRLRELLEMPS
ncbi:MAG TPA: sigma-70 family RNA polymerase sigma factor [Vicinamibacterales bacterium]|jgi:RNA polymerase sigma-70 factor (ECF subfamily)|nr:sigma-70 family RNA polymerase sigma factor [Vicinamibacterales bacterium]